MGVRSNSRPSVWLLSELYHPEETSTGHVMTRIAEGLGEQQPVGVICAQPTYSARGVSAPTRENRGGTKIRRVRSTRLDKNVSAYRLLNQVTISIAIFLRATLSLRRGDVVFAVTNPPLLPITAAMACVLRRATFVVVVHDVYPDAAVAAGMTRPGSLTTRLMEGLTRWTYRRAARIVVLGRDMRERVLAKIGPSYDAAVVVITNWADSEQVRPGPRSESRLLGELGLSNTFVLQFAGNIGPLQNIPFLLDVAEATSSDPHISYLFVGSGGRRGYLEAEIANRALSNVVVHDWIPRDQAADMHSASDAVVISLIPGMRGVSVPSRLYNALASGRPIFAACEEGSEVALVVEEEGVGWVIRPGDVDGFVAAIREALAHPEELKRKGELARKAAEDSYREDQAIAQFAGLVNRLSTQ